VDVAAVKELCSQFRGASSKLYGPPSNVLVYYVGGRKFAYFKTSEPEQWRFSVRTTPERFLALTDVPGIKPARYTAKFHWVTIVDVEDVAADYLQELIEWSHGRAATRSSRAARSLEGRPNSSLKRTNQSLRD
jgi:predicted DNA-binding protein (MmcQ/YjbR family)